MGGEGAVTGLLKKISEQRLQASCVMRGKEVLAPVTG